MPIIHENGVPREATIDEIEAIAENVRTIEELQAAESTRALHQYLQEFRDMRRELLNVLIGIAMAEDMLDEFKAARESLLNIPQLPSVENATTAAEAKAACKAAYMAVVAAAPPQFILAFKELNG